MRITTLFVATLLAAHGSPARASDADRCTIATPLPAIKVCYWYVNAGCPTNGGDETCSSLASLFSRLTGGESLASRFATHVVETEVPPSGGSIELTDSVQIDFGDGSFPVPQVVTVERTFDPTTQDLVSEQPDLFAVDAAPFQVTINTGEGQPDVDDTLVSIRLPDAWVAGARTQAIRVVARVTSSSEFDEITSFMEIVPAVEDPPGWLTFLLPTAAFVEEAGIYSAVLTLIRSEQPESSEASVSKLGTGCMPILGPLQSMNAGSEFGYRTDPVTHVRKLHSGIDYPVPIGTTILAPADGIVRANEWYSADTGNLLLLEHERGGRKFFTQYFHLMAPSPLAVGTMVTRGQEIGATGNTGKSTGPHLHFEFKTADGGKIDPARCFILNGTWSGNYSWDCGTSEAGDLVGSTALEATFKITGHAAFRAELSYLGSISVGGATISTIQPDGSADLSITAPQTSTSVYNMFNGTLHGASMSGTTINGDSPAGESPGCSATTGPSGTWHLDENKARRSLPARETSIPPSRSSGPNTRRVDRSVAGEGRPDANP